MSSYPPSKWKVRYLKDMQTLACESTEEDAISMAAYLAVRPSDGEEGSFRFVLHGPDNIKLKFPANRLLPSELFADMFIEAELKKKPEFGFQCLQALVSKLLARGELSR